jgi:hypothetical protein
MNLRIFPFKLHDHCCSLSYVSKLPRSFAAG